MATSIRFGSIFFLLILAHHAWAVDVTWNPPPAPGTYNWNVGTNWSGGAVPGSADVVIFDGSISNNNCLIDVLPPDLSAIRVINAFSGTINMNGFSLNINQSPFGDNSIYSGTFTNTTGTPVTFTINVTSGVTVTDLGTATLGSGPIFDDNIDVNIIITSGSLRVRNTTIKGSMYLEAPGITDVYANTFNTFSGTSTTTIRKSGTANNGWQGRNTVNGDAAIIQAGTGSLQMTSSFNDDFKKSLTLRKTSTGGFNPCYGGGGFGCLVAGNVTFYSTVASSTIVNTSITMKGNGTLKNKGTNPFTSITLRELKLDLPAASSVMNLDTTVNTSILTMTRGILNIPSSHLINIVSFGVVSGASDASYVKGKVRKTGLFTAVSTFDFPVGDNGRLRKISISQPGAADHYTAEYFYTEQPFATTRDASIVSMSDCEYWTLTKSTGASDVNVTLSWNATQCPQYSVTNLSHPQVIRWDGATWQNNGNGSNTGTPPSPYVTGTVRSSAAVTTWDAFPNPTYFTLGSSSPATVLPIELTDFAGIPNSEGFNQLEWTTASELNNLKFEIQRSFSGLEFSSIGELPGAGTTNYPNEYNFTDRDPSHLTYYRLKQIDYGGNSSYSKIITVRNTDLMTREFYVYPTRTTSVLFMSENANVVVYDNTARIVLRASQTKQLDLSNFKPGVYVIRTDRNKSARFVVN
jgi:hypothetical protein